MTNSSRNIGIAVLINLAFTIIEIIGGLWTNSLAILSDALHDFGDTLILGSSWFLEKQSNKGPDFKRTFGYKRLSLFSATLSGLILVAGSLYILSQAIPRLLNPQDVNALGMIGFAVIGIVFNGFALWRLHGGHDLNSKIISWHFVEDVIGWVIILIGAIITYFVNLPIIDPIITIIFTTVILIGVAKNLKEADRKSVV